MSLSRAISEKITQTYVIPFLASVRQAGLNEIDATRTALFLFQTYGENLLAEGAIAAILKANPSFRQNAILITPACQPSLLALGRIYLDNNAQSELMPAKKPQDDKQKEETDNTLNKEMIRMVAPEVEALDQLFGSTNSIEMQTAIRAILFDQINALPSLSKREVLPLLAKDAGTEANIMYGYTFDVPYKVKKRFAFFSCGYAEREDFSDEEVTDTLSNYGGMVLCPTLYEALDFASYQFLFSGRLCPVWAVAYKGNPQEVKFDDGGGFDSIGGRPMISRNNKRLKKEEVNESIDPLRGVLFLPGKSVIDYRILKTVDVPLLALKNEEASKPAPKP